MLIKGDKGQSHVVEKRGEASREPSAVGKRTRVSKIAPSRWSKRVKRRWFRSKPQVTEGWSLTKTSNQRNQKVSDTVRRTEVEVEDERVQKAVPLRLAAEDSSKQNEPHQLHAKRTPAA